jgi:hypothetical protein
MNGEVQRRDIAVSDQGFRVLADEIEIEIRQDPRRAPAAAHAHDGVHVGIGEHLVHTVRAGLVVAREIAVAVQDVVCPFRLQAEIGKRLLDQLDGEGLPGGRGRFDQADCITRFQPRRQENRQPACLRLSLRHCLRPQRQHRAGHPQQLSPVHGVRIPS